MKQQPQSRAASQEAIAGSIERVTFHSPESGFCVLRVKVRGHRDLVTITGSAASVSAGEYIDARGYWHNDRQHGLQFRAVDLRLVPPTTVAGIEKYLGSGMIRGIGPHFAKKLIAAFGESVFDVIEHEPDRLTECEGIGHKRASRIQNSFSEQKVVREIMVFLQSHGVGTARSVRIYKVYGDDAVNKVRENPYRLALDIHGIGFQTADKIAMSMGVPRESVLRAQAGIRQVLQDATGNGHCALPVNELLKQANAILEIPKSILEQAIGNEVREERLVEETVDDKPCLFLTPLQKTEQGITRHRRRLSRGRAVWGDIDTEKALTWVQKNTGLTFSSSQYSAVAMAVSHKVSIITGGLGVGKTTIVNGILRILRAKKIRIKCCAPTGRAAKRMEETTGIEATTIHRLLEFDPLTFGFKRDGQNPLETDLLVVDESSMIDTVIANQLFRAIPDNAGLLLVGDVDQLPSVGPGMVLRDLIESGVIATARLTEIFRQAAESGIVHNAHAVQQGHFIRTERNGVSFSDFFFIKCQTPEAIVEKLITVVTERIPRSFAMDPVRDIQVLTPMNRGGCGARSLNVELQKALNGAREPSITRFGWTYAAGDKVIQTVNNHQRGIYNGDVGTIEKIDPQEQLVYVRFDENIKDYEYGELDELSLAYAVSIHKSQGSEYPAVVIPLATQHFTLLERNLLYTGLTRGKALVVIIGQPKAVAMAIKRQQATRRITRLRERLLE